MPISSYAELQVAVANWLNRTDLSSRITEFITLAEADMRRQLRDKKTLASLTLTSGTISKALPATCKSLLSIRYNTGTYNHALREKTPSALAALRRTGTGMPQAYMVVDGVIYFDITPDSNYVMEIVYIEKIVALAVTSPNTTLTNSPDIYLYGALTQAAPYVEHDERSQLWSTFYENAVQKENAYREYAEFGASPEMELPVVFGEG